MRIKSLIAIHFLYNIKFNSFVSILLIIFEKEVILSNFKLLTIIVLCLLVTLSGNDSEARSTKYCLKMATLAPKTVGWARHIRKIMHPAIKKATDGHVKLKWYWGGVMGDDRDYVQKMQIGQLDGAALSGQGVVLACPEMAVVELPFMFENYEEVDYIRKEMRDEFDQIASQNGYKIFIWADQDFDQIYSVKYEMSQLSDFKKASILTWYGDLEMSLLSELGSDPIPVTVPEISSSIRQGIVDTLIAPSVWVIGSQMYTIMKYVNPVKIRYSPAAAFITLKSWNNIPTKYHKKLLKLRDTAAIKFCDKCRKDSIKAYKAMIKYGIKESIMTPTVLADFQSRTKKIWYDLVDKKYQRKTLEKLISHLEHYRKTHK